MPFAMRSRSPVPSSLRRDRSRKLDISHSKLNEVVHRDFADCSALAEPLSAQDGVVFCLGAYSGAVSDAELRTITVDYPTDFRASSSCQRPAAFSFLSGSGADPTGWMPFACYKGEAETALLGAGFHAFNFRPAYIYPVEPRKEPNFSTASCVCLSASIALPQPGDRPTHGPATVDVVVREQRSAKARSRTGAMGQIVSPTDCVIRRELAGSNGGTC